VRLKHDVDVGLATMELSRESLVIFNHLDDSERMLALSRQVLVLVPVTRGPKSIPRGSREV
jgi:acyl-CoA thioesterase FadM